jgi:hypothetical protein
VRLLVEEDGEVQVGVFVLLVGVVAHALVGLGVHEVLEVGEEDLLSVEDLHHGSSELHSDDLLVGDGVGQQGSEYLHVLQPVPDVEDLVVEVVSLLIVE